MLTISPVIRKSRLQNSRSRKSRFRFQSDWLLVGKFVQLESRNLAAPVFVLATPTPGIGAVAIDSLWDWETDQDTSDGSMSVSVAAGFSTDDWFNDGSGQQVSELATGTTQVTALNNVDGTFGIGISAAQMNQISAYTPYFNPNDQIAGIQMGSTVGTRADTLGDGTAAVSWGFGNSSDPSTPFTGSVTLTGQFQFNYSASWQEDSRVTLDRYVFASTATGVAVTLRGDGGLDVAYPSNGTIIREVINPVITASDDGGTETLVVDFQYSVVDASPAAGESIFYTSTIGAQARNLGAGPPAEDQLAWGVAQNSLTYSFSENAS